MSEVSKREIEEALEGYCDPYLQAHLIEAGAIKQLAEEEGKVSLRIELGFPAKHYAEQLRQTLEHRLQAVSGVKAVNIEIGSVIKAHAVQSTLQRMSHIKNIIAIGSGKGGVGKSTVSANVALALAQEGARVGMLDADIYGPSQPRMLGLDQQKLGSRDNKIEPLESHGVKLVSIGLMVDEETPTIWRGPMVTGALTQMLNDTDWGELDYLIIDLPPGTGDTQLTLVQKIPVSAAIIVTTPQDIALLDARKGLQMFRKVDVPVLGVIENMSTHICSECGHEEHIFGIGGGVKMATDYDVELLGSLPLDIRIREQADAGLPSVAADPEGELAQKYRDISLHAAALLSQKKKDYSAAFPKIVIENN
ncbi:MAG: iron-sulfur cluster carrier protein ApbC [Gammaproteobacteria bacterium]|nr:iron-sulfur cluster carrier protein ApbC [Gammaproteobacteria bacterium]